MTERTDKQIESSDASSSTSANKGPSYEQLDSAEVKHSDIRYKNDPARQRLIELQRLAAQDGNPFKEVLEKSTEPRV